MCIIHKIVQHFKDKFDLQCLDLKLPAMKKLMNLHMDMGVFICIYIYISVEALRNKSRLFVNKWVEKIEILQKNYKKKLKFEFFI